MITLVFGGARSGKSSFAEDLALKIGDSGEERCYLASGVAFDAEMKKRIEIHKQRRTGKFYTKEEPYNLGRAILDTDSHTKVILIDCLTTWLGNLTCRAFMQGRDTEEDYKKYGDSLEVFPEIEEFFQALKQAPCDIIIVSNELGLGIVPADAGTRLFRDRQGRLNQQAAKNADRAVFMAAGLPLCLKGSL